MAKRCELNLRLNASAVEVLEKIKSSTEREELPFISASRYPQQKEKEFVSRISGSRFRVWKVPPSSKIRQNMCIPYLHGTVTDSTSGSTLAGSFALHPFNKLLLLLPPVVVVLAWVWWGDKTVRSVAALTIFSTLFLWFEIAMLCAIRRLRPSEERDIARYLAELLGARLSSLRER